MASITVIRMPQPITNILQQADELIHGDRQKDYGHPLDNHKTTAELWSAYLKKVTGKEIDLSPEDVCVLNILQKVSRGGHRITRDTIIDIAGYAGNMEMIQNERKRRAGK